MPFAASVASRPVKLSAGPATRMCRSASRHLRLVTAESSMRSAGIPPRTAICDHRPRRSSGSRWQFAIASSKFSGYSGLAGP